MQERRNGVTQMVSYLGYPGLSERGNFMGKGGLIPSPVVLLVVVSYSWQYVYLGWKSSEMYALTIKNLMSSTQSILQSKNLMSGTYTKGKAGNSKGNTSRQWQQVSQTRQKFHSCRHHSFLTKNNKAVRWKFAFSSFVFSFKFLTAITSQSKATETLL